jgi:photosystem II stability/assembly factor-like uncharacterized protein
MSLKFMVRIKQYFFIILGFVFTIHANCQWTKSTLEGYFNRAIFHNKDTGILIGNHGEVFLTTNQGLTWEDRSIPFDTQIQNAQFINDSSIYLVTYGNAENFYLSWNLGLNWEVKTIANSSLADLHFFNDSVGLLATIDSICLTSIMSQKTNKIWTFPKEDSVKYWGTNSLLFITDSIGFINGTMLRSINGFNRFRGFIIKTNNKGQNWEYVFKSDSITFIESARLSVNQNRIYTYDDLNIIYSADTDLLIWKIMKIPYSIASIPSSCKNEISSVFFISPNIGYAILSPMFILLDPLNDNGYDLILKTYDGGDTWNRQYIDTFLLSEIAQNPTLSDIIFLDDSIGIACGFNKIIKTTNQGGGIISGMPVRQIEDPMIKFVSRQLIIEPVTIPEYLIISLYDVSGRKIRNFLIKDTENPPYSLSMESIEKGVYFIEVIFDRKYRYTKKILIW